MDDKLLRKQIIRLAHENPTLREHLLPLVASEDEDDGDKEAIIMIQQMNRKKKKKAEEDVESRHEEGPMSPAEKKELFEDNPEFAEAHRKYKDKLKGRKSAHLIQDAMKTAMGRR